MELEEGQRQQFGHIRKASIPSTIVADPARRFLGFREYILASKSITPPSLAHKLHAPETFLATVESSQLALSHLSSPWLRTSSTSPLSPTHLSLSSSIGASGLLGSLLGMPRCTSSVNYQTETATMSELICNGCFSLVLYNRGAANVRCSRCNMLNSTRSASQYAHLKCGGCRTTLMYPPGASTVGCATCHHVNPVRAQGSSAPPDVHARPQTVLVENPRTMNDKGKLVSNVAVGVTSWKR